MAKREFIVRNMKEADFEEVRQLWIMANFIAFKYVNEAMYGIDPDGFFVAQDVKTGQLLGCCSGVNLSSELAFIGQYTVHPDCRGSGIGSALWSRVMDHIGNERNVSLNAAIAMFEKYRDRSGFKIVSDKQVACFKGDFNCSQLVKNIDGISVVDISEDNAEEVIQYDKQISGLDRRAMIRGLIKTPDTVTKMALNGDNQVVGYGVIGIGTFGDYTIEPLYANDQEIAELVINKCHQSLPQDQAHQLFYHLWDSHAPSLAIAKKIGLELKSKEPMLFTKKVYEGDMDKAFSMASSAFFPY